ncbi:MAG: preprotein translocase subunit YajC [Armatimonadetes bacterium]|nr:preprotein translocase subunit YajC [Armatimonadota bacterium]
MPQQVYSWSNLVPVVVFVGALVVMFWWIVVRPEKKRIRDHIELVRSLKPGDKVVTAGGIHGTIVEVKERVVELEVATKVVLTVDKYAVRRRVQEDRQREEQKKR